MKNKKITDAWDNIYLGEENNNRITEKIRMKLQPQKKQVRFTLKHTVAAAIIFVMLVTTVAASAPLIFKTLGLSFMITQDNMNYIEGLEHDIVIESIDISPGYNILTITEKGGVSQLDTELFANFFIVDDKNNFYGQAEYDINGREKWENDITYSIAFNGEIPSDAQYIKLIPYNFKPIPEIASDIEKAKKDKTVDSREFYTESKEYIENLPYSFKQSEYGNVIIESCEVDDIHITLTYKHDGMVKPPFIVITDGEKTVSPSGQLSQYKNPVYNPETDSYTIVFSINRPIKEPKGIKVIQYDINLLEEQSITIPLK